MPATDKVLRKPSRMHVIFACSSVALTLTVFWMMADDHADSWRDYQKEYFRLKAEKLRAREAALKSPEYNEQIKDLEAKLENAEKRLENKKSEIYDLEQRLASHDVAIGNQERQVRADRAELSVAAANYGLGVRDEVGPRELEELKEDYDYWKEKVEAEIRRQERLELLRDEDAERLAELTSAQEDIEKELSELKGKVEDVHSALTEIAPESLGAKIKRKIMEWPVIDGFNSHLEIKQDWIPDLHVTLGMTESARFDHCRTCHMGIDELDVGGVPMFPFGKREEGKYPHPFATHPRLDVYLSSTSPHPRSEFGCTICHDGQGYGTEFSNSSHTPDNPAEKEMWEEEYGYHANHFWEYPMLSKTFRESSCLKCHHNVVELGASNEEYGATAPKLVEGWNLIREYGCFGCHQINGYKGTEPIGPDLRLEPRTLAEKEEIESDPNMIAGKMRKVGPSLEHVGQKTTQGWLESWLENPAHFRPTTRMPRFFGLTNQQDEDAKRFNPVEIAAIATYLRTKSKEMELDAPKEGYQPNAERGAREFATRGCLACHYHDGVDGATRETGQNFGPDLSRIHAKLKPGEDGFRWLYTWVRNPEKYHPRTKMPHMFLEPETVKGEYHDPAADIAAFLLSRQTAEGETAGIEQHAADDYPFTNFDNKKRSKALDDLVILYLSTVLKKDEIVGNPNLTVEGVPGVKPKKVEGFMQTRRFPMKPEAVKGDEVELLSEERPDDEEWRQMKLRYVGRRTISRYGCFGCHEIPGFEEAKPIGTALQDWGRKDTTKLAFEHIVEYLEHHGEPDGGSTHERVEEAVDRRLAGESPEDNEQLERDLHAAARYESILHHGRDGFLWQKLRQPRSYDYEKTTTKGYDERLRMPKFPLDEKQIEAISTFVLGLVAEPPSDKYVYNPGGAERDLIEGERLLQKYNCRGCHMTDLPEITFAMQEGDFLYHEGLADDEYQQGYELLMHIKPPRQGLTDEKATVEYFGETGTYPVVNFRGLLAVPPDPLDPPEDQETGFDVWETLKVGEELVTPATRVTVIGPYLLDHKPGNGGRFAEWLVERLVNESGGLAEGKRGMGWQMSPPILYKEGAKVQTPWLYNFLLNPYKIRHLTVLRMPRFNMDPEEAQILANYFAAKDEVPYPYLDVPQREQQYLERKNAEFASEFDKSHDYLTESWRVLNANICIGCHSVGGREVKVDPMDPSKSIRGPDLNQTRDRLRPDWMALWIFKPPWITPGTAMPVNFARNKKVFEDVPPDAGNGLFGGDGEKQVIGVRDALMNYYRLIERDGPIVYEPPKQPEQPTGQAGNE